MLKLNDDKTELIVFASRYNQHLYSDVTMMIGNTTVVCEPQVKNLGVIFDQVMLMRQHVNYTSRTARFHLRNISRIRRYIPEESCKLVVQSLVVSQDCVVCLYYYIALNGLAPEYLCNMVELYAPDRVLRSASQNLLVVPRRKHCQYDVRTFAMVAATL